MKQRLILIAVAWAGVCFAADGPRGAGRDAAAQAERRASPFPAAQEALFKQKIAGLLAQKDWQWIRFEEKSGVMIEVARPEYNGRPEFVMNIVALTAFAESPDAALVTMGVKLPAGWKMTEWPLETSAEFSAPKADEDKLPAFLHAVFLKCFKCAPDYTVTCSPGKP